MIVFKPVEEAHVQLIGGVVTQADPGIGIRRHLAMTLLVLAVHQPFADGKKVGTDPASEIRQPAADDIFIKGDHRVLETVGRIIFGGVKLSLCVGQKGGPMILVQLFQELMSASFNSFEQYCVVG